MKVTLISPTPLDLYAPGIRSLSAYLKRHGYETRLIFLPGSTERHLHKNYVYQYKSSLIDDMAEICEDSLLIGVSFMTQFFDRAVQVSQELKKRLDTPVIWGGIHPTAKVEESLEYADIVCVGEGEEALLDLLQKIEKGQDYFGVSNMCFNIDGKIKKNPVRPLIQDLDSLPYLDYDLDEHYVLDRDESRLLKIDNDLMSTIIPGFPDKDRSFLPAYKTMITRGCTHRCAYCGNSLLREMYHHQRYLRRRSNTHIIDELVHIKNKLEFIQFIRFQDDNFFATSAESIKEFSELYKDKVGLPFEAQGTPDLMTEEKFKYLLDAGLVFTELGIQSGSRSTLNLYNRNTTSEQVKKAAFMIHKYQDRINIPDYHIILDNPWETPDDLKETLELIWTLPKPYNLLISSLVFYPGTILYEKATSEGLIKDERSEIYRKHFPVPKGSYLNFVFYLSTFNGFPKGVLSMLANDGCIRMLHRNRLEGFFSILQRMVDIIRRVKRGFSALLNGDIRKNIKYFKRAFSFWK